MTIMAWNESTTSIENDGGNTQTSNVEFLNGK
jgi:hypothetical protein